jgi:hypothetical protein
MERHRQATASEAHEVQGRSSFWNDSTDPATATGYNMADMSRVRRLDALSLCLDGHSNAPMGTRSTQMKRKQACVPFSD